MTGMLWARPVYSARVRVLRRLGGEPPLHRRGAIALHRVEQRFGLGLRNHHRAVAWLQQLLSYCVIEQREQPSVVALHVEQATRFGVQPELRPGQDFAEFLESAEAARKGNEAIAQVRHQLLA